MSFVSNFFLQLSRQYPSWSSLCQHLESEEGGKLRCIEVGDYAIVRYVKGVSDLTNAGVRHFRSVVWDTRTNRPVCVAPVKAQTGEPPAGSPLRVMDFVDGVMINVFQDASGVVNYATRTNLGASNSFYTKKTFAEMLDDCLAPVGGAHSFFSRVLQPGQFASFVMQHPDHKTVGQIAVPRLTCIHVGSVSEDGGVKFDVDPNLWPSSFYSYAVPVYEQTEVLAESKDAWKFIKTYQGKGHTWQGVVFLDTATGQRWRLRNSDFVKVRTLRGPEADSFARYLRLRTTGQMKQYLQYFREESNRMWAYENLWRETTQALFDSYVQMHKLKQKTMKELPLPLRPHVYALHGKYLASLPTPQAITKSTVIEYVNSLAIEDQLKMVGGTYLNAEWLSANKL